MMLRDLLTYLATSVGAGTVLGVFLGGTVIEMHGLFRGQTLVGAPRLIERYGVYGGLFGVWVAVADLALRVVR